MAVSRLRMRRSRSVSHSVSISHSVSAEKPPISRARRFARRPVGGGSNQSRSRAARPFSKFLRDVRVNIAPCRVLHRDNTTTSLHGRQTGPRAFLRQDLGKENLGYDWKGRDHGSVARIVEMRDRARIPKTGNSGERDFPSMAGRDRLSLSVRTTRARSVRQGE